VAKITDYDRQNYQVKINKYAAMTRSLLELEKNFLAANQNDSPDTSLNKLNLVDEMLNLTSYYIIISGISQVVLKTKNEEALNEARKSLYRAVIYLEEIVSRHIDAPFSEYEEKHAMIESFDENQRYRLIRKMGLAVDLLEDAYGDNSKWRWTFVELEGRFAVVAKNILNLRNAYANTDPESPFYESTVYHLRLIKKLLLQSADRYRQKYELSTSQTHDFKLGIAFLSALRRIHLLLSENDDAEEVKKRLNIWTAKLDSDTKKQEEAKKKAALPSPNAV